MKKKLDKKGLTLLELLFAFSIFLAVIFGVFTLYSISSKADKNVWESSFVQSLTSKAIQTFVDEIRTTNYSTVGGYPLALASTTEIIFYANIDSDSLMERVRYFVDGDTFKKGITKPTGTLLYEYSTSTEEVSEIVYNLQTPVGTVFTYYDENYNGATVTSSMSYPIFLPEIRVVGISLRVKQNSLSGSSIFEIQSKAQLRNLKTN
ncbi:MAG TPA: hypothetical protein P5230_02535 [Candidatus Magasanikbacteria bacterium]|nr:hypothetical protein [Candidatus Magasanikbacteria bacterium]